MPSEMWQRFWQKMRERGLLGEETYSSISGGEVGTSAKAVAVAEGDEDDEINASFDDKDDD